MIDLFLYSMIHPYAFSCIVLTCLVNIYHLNTARPSRMAGNLGGLVALSSVTSTLVFPRGFMAK